MKGARLRPTLVFMLILQPYEDPQWGARLIVRPRMDYVLAKSTCPLKSAAPHVCVGDSWMQ